MVDAPLVRVFNFLREYGHTSEIWVKTSLEVTWYNLPLVMGYRNGRRFSPVFLCLPRGVSSDILVTEMMSLAYQLEILWYQVSQTPFIKTVSKCNVCRLNACVLLVGLSS